MDSAPSACSRIHFPASRSDFFLDNHVLVSHFVWGVPAAFGAGEDQYVAELDGARFASDEEQLRDESGENLHFADELIATVLTLWYRLAQWSDEKRQSVPRVSAIEMH